jgi:cytochrome c biogenesis protein CcmG, thiol:disulfide interchange protein DsbE
MILPPVIFAGLAAMFYLGMQRDDPDALPSVRPAARRRRSC